MIFKYREDRCHCIKKGAHKLNIPFLYILWFKLIYFTEQWWGLQKGFESFAMLELYASIFISILIISSENWTLLLHPKNKQTKNQKQKPPAIVLAAYSIKCCLVLWLQNLSQINWLIQKKARFSPIGKTDLGFGIILSFKFICQQHRRFYWLTTPVHKPVKKIHIFLSVKSNCTQGCKASS